MCQVDNHLLLQLYVHYIVKYPIQLLIIHHGRDNNDDHRNQLEQEPQTLFLEFFLVGFLKCIFQKQNETIFASLALREERKCSGRCRHLRKEASPERVAPENLTKIQWLTLQLHSNYFKERKPPRKQIFLSLVYRTRIQSFVQREHELKEDNKKLRETISNIERSAHDTVAVNLRRFDQYQV